MAVWFLLTWLKLYTLFFQTCRCQMFPPWVLYKVSIKVLFCFMDIRPQPSHSEYSSTMSGGYDGILKERIQAPWGSGETGLVQAEPPRCWWALEAWAADGVDRLVEPGWIAGRHQKCEADKIYITCWHSCAWSKWLFLWIRIWFLYPHPQAPFEGLCWVWDRCGQSGVSESTLLVHTSGICVFSAAFEKEETCSFPNFYLARAPCG
jgi:hypothetical protein